MIPHIKLLENKIIEILHTNKKELEHGLETKKWILKLYPDSHELIQIAALAHDIERVVPDIPNMTPPKITKLEDEEYEVWKQRHGIRSAIIIEHLMKAYLFTDAEIARVKEAIAYHDDPNELANLDLIAVRDADSVRFFDSGLPNYIEAFSVESAKIKAKFMYERCSDLAKTTIKSLSFNKELKDSLIV